MVFWIGFAFRLTGAKKQLDNQIHHYVHDSNVNEHVRHKSPNLFTFPWVVDEETRSRSTGWCSDIVDVSILVFSAKVF